MKRHLSRYHHEVTKYYLNSGKPFDVATATYLQERMYCTRYKVHQLDNLAQARLLKHPFSFYQLDQMERAKVWTHIFKQTQYLGIGSLAIDYFKKIERKKNGELVQYWPELKTWVHHIENWAHGDMLASLYASILESEPKLVYPELVKWAKDKNPWRRRMALISLIYYYRCRDRVLPFKQIMALLKPQLAIDHYYLQKAVGWLLRELTQAYPKETWEFLDSYAEQLSGQAFTTAMEKLPQKQRAPLKQRRVLDRKQKRAQVTSTKQV